MSFEHIHALAKGTRINQYEMMQILGAGGFGITYLARDTMLDATVAIKEYLPGDLATRLGDSTVTAKSSNSKGDFDWGMTRFLEEARVLAKFRHPNIIHINQIFEKNNTAYIVMDYAKGESLEAMLHRTGPLSEQQTKDILFPILDGLKRVHALGFLHRDIKPGNIIVRDEDGAVLIDFGAAREATGSKSKAITSIVTEGYAPLEQYDATGNQGPWTDIYALGAVAYKCLTGTKPPSATSRVRTDHLVPLSVAIPGRVSEDFASAIEQSLRLNETERPQTIDEFLAVVSGATLMHQTPPADATVMMRPDATVVVQPVSGPLSVKPDQTSATKSFAPASAKRAPPASVKVAPPESVTPASAGTPPPSIKAEPAPVARSRAPLYLGAAAAILLMGGAGAWYYVQNAPTPPANVTVASATTGPAPTPASLTPATPPPAAAPLEPAPTQTVPAPSPSTTAPPPAELAPPPPNVVAAPPPARPANPPLPADQTAKGPTPAPTPPAPPPPPKFALPPGPPTPAKAVAMLNTFSDPVLKATLAQPGLRSRVETLMGLEGCNWRVNANAAKQPETRAAANYLNRMDDDTLRDVLTDGVVQDRIDAQFGRGSCNVTRQQESTITNGFPDQSNTNRDPGGYPGALPGDYGQRQNGRRPPVAPGAPYGYGGVVPGYVP